MSLLTRLFGKTAGSTEILCPHCERSMDAGHDAEACARKGMSRRYFFGLMGGAAAAVVVAPALPKYLGTVGKFNLRALQSNVRLARTIQRDYNRHLSMVGETTSVREPVRFRR